MCESWWYLGQAGGVEEVFGVNGQRAGAAEGDQKSSRGNGRGGLHDVLVVVCAEWW
jgi:hypothetical protein